MQLAAFRLDSSDWENWAGGGILFAADGLCLCKTFFSGVPLALLRYSMVLWFHACT